METLSSDIILLIGDHIEDINDRYNAIFLNHRFYELFSHALFRSVTLKNRTQLQSFLKALMHRPNLAAVVRSLDLGEWQPETSHPHPHLSPEDLAMFSLCARTMSQSTQEYVQWENDLISGVEEAWIALLLPMVNNIRQLKLTHASQNLEDRYLDRTFARAVNQEIPFDQQPAFHRLEEVSLKALNDYEEQSTFDPSQILPFFQLPSLRSFSANSLVEYRPSSDLKLKGLPKNLIKGDSPISDINLTSSNGGKGLETLLPLCSALKSFKHQHSDDYRGTDGFNPTAFHQTLSQSKSTLETLWLDNLGVHFAFTDSGLNESCDGWFGSLADFAVLTDLRIRLPNLLDIQSQLDPSIPLTDILPSSLETLYIEGCRENSLDMLIRQVRLVLEVRKTKFPALRRVDIEGRFHDDDDDLDASGVADMEGISGKIIRSRVYEMMQPVVEGCGSVGVEMFLRDRECLQTMREIPAGQV
ncbi:hypothetical protein BDW59DRAFT_181951 [Aspergillus cavernicola]|uniref:Leucine-rich repeat domain-containing protein n=1 Tax=Aspergillus cavernicola TaxID=176166 RepID=A0ABR4HU42_9EURO